ncbi:hypothetical protein PLESTB_000102500 [Pleodorina starrii]|uniref:Sec1 family domain-containing protein 2 n=1 Tax=Pleodorina starrii TaxID=330485 RepID=A0A9W6EXP6_9CHLO|nr:hypothetical protein PLESTM_000099100 [Pleodorina starrii]GLC48480.1 hypothetical protein PLESTB_000102500 [Pleodorina starrii]GLC71800.1 hypothetical protein PLESTF_001168300 [Pleodorina starrii]
MFEVIQGPVLELAESLQGSLLYLDAGAGEIAQTTLGLPFLLGLGVSHVCSLETASPEDAAFPLLVTGSAPTQLVIFTTQLLTDAHQYILRAVLAHSATTSVSVFSSVSEHAHACQAATELGVEAYREYAELLQSEVRRARAAQAPAGAGGGVSTGGVAPPALSVRVAFLPLLACCVDPGLFVLPAASSAARRAVAGGLAAGFGALEPGAGDAAAAGEGASGGLSLTAHGLLALAAAMGAPRPEPFAVGPVSAALAAELASLPSVSLPPSSLSAGSAAAAAGGTAASTPSLALILVDRSLDLATPCTHTDHPWDVLLAAAAARQAAAATRAAAAAAGGGGAAAAAPHGGGSGAQAVWRPLDLRVALPAPTDAVPLETPWLPHGSGSGDSAVTAGGNLPYGQLSYDTYGVELLDPTDRTAIARVEAVAGRPRRDGLAALRRGLKEALRAEKLTPAVRSKAGAVQAPELRGLAEPLVAASGACSRQRGVAAMALAVAEAMTAPAAAEAEAAAGLGRSVLAALAGAGGGGGGCEAAVQVLLDALTAAKSGRGLLHVGHVLELLPAAFSAAADSDAAAAAAAPSSSPTPSTASAGGGGSGSGSCPFSAQQQSALRAALAAAVLSCGSPGEALAGRLPADLVAALAARAAARQAAGKGKRRTGEGKAEAEDGKAEGEGVEARDRGARQQGGDAAHVEADVEADNADPWVVRRLSAVLDALFGGLRYAAVARNRLKTFRKVTHVDVFAENHGSLSPLLRQLVRRVMQRADVTDWQQQSSSGGAGGGLVRGLLGGLMGASRALVGRAAGGGGGGLAGSGSGSGPLPADFGTVVVFVVGGVSPAEVREVRAELDEHVGPAKPRVLLGGTSLLLPQDVTLQLVGGPLPLPPPL